MPAFEQPAASGLWGSITGAVSGAASAVGGAAASAASTVGSWLPFGPVIGPQLPDLYSEESSGGSLPFGLLDDAQIAEINESARRAGEVKPTGIVPDYGTEPYGLPPLDDGYFPPPEGDVWKGLPYPDDLYSEGNGTSSNQGGMLHKVGDMVRRAAQPQGSRILLEECGDFDGGCFPHYDDIVY